MEGAAFGPDLSWQAKVPILQGGTKGTMSELPSAARAYLTAVTAVGILALVWAIPQLSVPEIPWIVLLVAVCIGADRIRVPIGAIGTKSAASISLGAGATFLSLLLMKTPAAIAIVALSSVAVFWKNPSRYQSVFNTAVMLLSATVTGLLIQSLGIDPSGFSIDALSGPKQVWGLAISVIGFLAVAVVHFLINSLLIARIVAFVSGQKVLAVWRGNFLWALPAHLTSASIALLGFALVRAAVEAWWVTLLLALAALPIPAVLITGFRYRRQWEEENAARLVEQQAHIEALTASKTELEKMHSATVEAFALAIDAKDQYTQEHIQRVQLISVALARALDLPDEEVRAIETGAALHDIGKIAIPEHILNKPGRLTDEEFALIQRHPELGVRILEPVQFPQSVIGAVRNHHEKWNGRGYPDGLSAENIPLSGRILAVADVYDALTSDRPYRPGWTHERARDLIVNEAGSHFDPQMVEAFLRVMEEQPDLRAGSEAAQRRARERFDRVRKLHRPSDEFVAINGIAQLASAGLGLGELAGELTAQVMNLYKASACLLLLEGDDGVLSVRSASGANAPYFQGARADRANGPTRKVWDSGEAFLGEYDTAELLLNATVGEWVTLGAGMAVPVGVGAGRLGVLCVYHTYLDAFDEEDLRLLSLLGERSAEGVGAAWERERARVAATRGGGTVHALPELLARLEQEIAWCRSEDRPLSLVRLVYTPCAADVLGGVRASLRGGDLLAPCDEGALLIALSATDAAGARIVANSLPRAVPDEALPLSLDVVTYPADGDDVSALLAAVCHTAAPERAAPLRRAA